MSQLIPSSLQSYVHGEWFSGQSDLTPVFHSVTGEHITEVGSAGLDVAGIMTWGRSTGGPALRSMTFHQRALMLKALAQHLLERKELFYEVSKATGATRNDSWIDIEGGIGTLFSYASKGRRELPDLPFYLDGSIERLGKTGSFVGQHICTPLEGVAIHINAFNFPCWGMLEKLAPTLLAGMPAVVKPATSTAYLAHAMVKVIIQSKILPEGALQLVCGSLGDMFSQLTCQDVVTLTGSKATGTLLKQHPSVIEHSVRFNLEADSLNCSILGEQAEPGSEEFSLFIKEVVREISVKAGQKCTAIRRILVPRRFESAVLEELSQRLANITIGDPETHGIRMGPLVSREQAQAVQRNVELLLTETERITSAEFELTQPSDSTSIDAFFPPTLLRCRNGTQAELVHSIEAFGPVSTLISYESPEEAIALARRGQGSLCASIFTPHDGEARTLALGIAPFHGRILLVNSTMAAESTGHGSPLPHLVHGGPGRAGGGEELGGIRSVLHYLQRSAIQGSPQTLTTATGQWFPGAAVNEDSIHPFRKHFEELLIGESFRSHGRTVTEADIVNFAGISGDHFYAHLDEPAARESIFGGRVAHGYLVLAIAAGQFVDPAPGPMLANLGLENLRFLRPVYPGDTIRTRVTVSSKSPKAGKAEGIVEWEVEVANQLQEIVASYRLLTLVRRRASE